jgi:CheY-like chemotaxis protein
LGKILVVDDESEICELLEDFLTGKGYVVTTATRGREAINNLKKGPFDLMLLDMRMPEMDGFQVMEEAKSILPDLGVIMVTAVQDEAVAERAIKAGAFDYITKPIDLLYLEKSVSTRLARQGR